MSFKPTNGFYLPTFGGFTSLLDNSSNHEDIAEKYINSSDQLRDSYFASSSASAVDFMIYHLKAIRVDTIRRTVTYCEKYYKFFDNDLKKIIKDLDSRYYRMDIL